MAIFTVNSSVIWRNIHEYTTSMKKILKFSPSKCSNSTQKQWFLHCGWRKSFIQSCQNGQNRLIYSPWLKKILKSSPSKCSRLTKNLNDFGRRKCWNLFLLNAPNWLKNIKWFLHHGWRKFWNSVFVNAPDWLRNV